MRFGQTVRNGVGFIAFVALLLAPSGLTNQPASVAWAQPADPPARVGRLNYMSGPVSFAPGGINQWAKATLNYPLTTGTALWTDENGRAELHVGSTAIRMDQTTELSILNLDDQTTQLRVAQGTIDIGLHHLAVDELFEVATPSASIILVRPGHYRFQADENGARVTVWTGEVDVATSTYAFSVFAGQTVLVSESGHQIVATPALDAFDQWSLAREAHEARASQVALQYVPPTLTGYEDLASYGTWRTVQGHGATWFPTVHPGWAPYRHGQWVWISPWGWTWVDSAPWGFAPFHYGRWVLIGGLWAWVPDRVFARPIFAPALVVFLVIGDIIGWFPLAPQEVYVPPYYASPAYYSAININIVNINITNINITNVTHVFRESPKAITLVRKSAFVQANPVAKHLVSVPTVQVERAKVTSAAALQPNVKSVLGHPDGTVGSRRPPTVVEQRPVVVRRAPPALPKPQAIGVQAPARNVLVKPVGESRRVAPPPQPDTVAPQPQPKPIAPNPAQPGVPTPRPVRPVAPPPQPGIVAPQPKPQPAQPAVPGPNPGSNPMPTPHRVRPVDQAPQPPRPVMPAPHPAPTPPPAQLVVPPRPQPSAPVLRPAPPQQVVPMPPQPRVAPQAPRNLVKPPVCDERSPNYDPRQCPQNRPRGH